MNKKAILTMILSLAIAAGLLAEEPSIGVEFGQSLESEMTKPDADDYFAVSNNIMVTEFKANAKYKMGDTSVTPWIKGKIENDGGTWTNYTYFGIDLGLTLSDSMSIALKNEFYVDAVIGDAPENEYTPKLSFSSSFGDLGLGVTLGDEITFKGEDTTMDIEAGLNLDYSLSAVDISLAYALNYDLGDSDIENDEKMENDVTLKLAFDLASLGTYVGAAYAYDLNNDSGTMEAEDNYIGGIIGLNMKKDNWSLNIEYNLGMDSEQEQLEGKIKAGIKTKI